MPISEATFSALSSPVPIDSENEHDLALMRGVAAGSEDAMRELVERHQGRVYGTIVRMLGSDREAEDLAQQVFVRVWESAGRYQPTAKFTTWLYTIVRNLVFNETRRREKSSLSDELNESLHDENQSSPADDLLAGEKMQAIQAAIDALPEQQRLAVIMRRYDDVSYEEIAVVLKQTVPGVKSLLFRARQALRESLAKYLE